MPAIEKNQNDTSSMNILGRVYVGMAEHAKNLGNLNDALLAAKTAIEYFDKILSIAPTSQNVVEFKASAQAIVNTANDELDAAEERPRYD